MDLKNNIHKIIHNQNFKHGALYTIFAFINNGIGFVLVLILAKYLVPAEYGQLNLFNTFITLFNIIIALSTTSYISVCFFQKSRETLQQVIFVTFAVTSGMLIIISLFIILFPNLTERIAGIPIIYLWLGLFICYFTVFNNVNLDIWRLEEKPLSYGIYSTSYAITNFVFSFILIVVVKLGWEGRVYAWFSLGVVYFFISLIFLIKRKYLILKKPSLKIFTETLLYALPILPHSASFWLKQGMDRYIINYFHEQAAVGYYSFAMNLAAIIGVIGTAFNSTNSVFIYKNLAIGYETVKNTLRKQNILMTGVFLVISILVALFAWCLISWFLTKYTLSAQYIIPLCIGGFFQCLYLLWVNYLFYYKKTKELMYITLSTAIFQLGLSLWLTRYSIIWTAYISMSVSILIYFMVYYISSKELKYQNNEII